MTSTEVVASYKSSIYSISSFMSEKYVDPLLVDAVKDLPDRNRLKVSVLGLRPSNVPKISPEFVERCHVHYDKYLEVFWTDMTHDTKKGGVQKISLNENNVMALQKYQKENSCDFEISIFFGYHD